LIGLAALLVGWLLVVASEAATPFASGWLILFLLAFQVIAWTIALAATLFCLGTIRVGKRRLGGRPLGVALMAVVALLIGAGAVWFTNWGAIAPAPYLSLHRAQFDYVSSHPPVGHDFSFGKGARLPLLVRDISVDGNAYDIADDPSLIVIPEFYGIPDDASGFVYGGSGPAGDRALDLSGKFVELADCDRLSGGWYYC
jgi:hypothetical protein